MSRKNAGGPRKNNRASKSQGKNRTPVNAAPQTGWIRRIGAGLVRRLRWPSFWQTVALAVLGAVVGALTTEWWNSRKRPRLEVTTLGLLADADDEIVADSLITTMRLFDTDHQCFLLNAQQVAYPKHLFRAQPRTSESRFRFVIKNHGNGSASDVRLAFGQITQEQPVFGASHNVKFTHERGLSSDLSLRATHVLTIDHIRPNDVALVTVAIPIDTLTVWTPGERRMLKHLSFSARELGVLSTNFERARLYEVDSLEKTFLGTSTVGIQRVQVGRDSTLSKRSSRKLDLPHGLPPAIRELAKECPPASPLPPKYEEYHY